ncbi:MAG: hypothetical protein KDB48_10800 [Solirubrobacterales bacterium]|nr:hypothetical protein [Solirubrobacterales bacterium]HMT05337.1 hypothetical protein [Solirubrobacterales bacterium]
MRFLLGSVSARVISILCFLAIGAAYLLITGSDGERPKSQEQITKEQLDQSTKGVRSVADSAATGLQVYNADMKLLVDGDYDRYQIRNIELSDGDLSVFTSMPPGKASQAKAAKLCEKLIGSDPPLVAVNDFVFVFGSGLSHIRADECDIRHWQGSTASAG